MGDTKIPGFWGDQNDVKAQSIKNEKRLAKRLNANRTPASGATQWPSSKGDEISEQFMFESKETSGTTIKLTFDIIKKLYNEALRIGKDPAFVLTFYEMPFPFPKGWVVLPQDVFEKLTQDVD